MGPLVWLPASRSRARLLAFFLRLLRARTRRRLEQTVSARGSSCFVCMPVCALANYGATPFPSCSDSQQSCAGQAVVWHGQFVFGFLQMHAIATGPGERS